LTSIDVSVFNSCIVASSCNYRSTDLLFTNAELIDRQHRGLAFVLPAAYWSMDAARAGGAFLGPCAADVNVRSRDGRGRSRIRGALRCRCVAQTLNDEWSRLLSDSSSDQYAKSQYDDRRQRNSQELWSHKGRRALVAKSPAGPKTPAQADDLLPAFGAKIWTISREERQVRKFLSSLLPVL